VLLPDGKVKVFGADQGVVSALFDPRSNPPFTELEPGRRILQGEEHLLADAACVRRLDGSFYMVFKRQP
jgi:hypothetical protein